MDITHEIWKDIRSFCNNKWGNHIFNTDTGGDNQYHIDNNLGCKYAPIYVTVRNIDNWNDLILKYSEKELIDYIMEILRNKFPEYKGLMICFEKVDNPRSKEDLLGIRTI